MYNDWWYIDDNNIVSVFFFLCDGIHHETDAGTLDASTWARHAHSLVWAKANGEARVLARAGSARLRPRTLFRVLINEFVT